MAAVDILKAFEIEPPPFDFVLPGMLASTVGFVLSPGGTGKSMLAVEVGCAIAGAVASGKSEADLLGFEPKQGKVFYLAAEDPELAIWHRLHAMGKRFSGSTRQAIAENLTVQSVVGKMPNIMDPRWHQAIINGCKGYRLIILDTLSRFHALDENSNGDMASIIAMLEYIAAETGASILVVHHSSKSMAVAGRGDEQQAGRGASSLIDNARWAANLIGMTKEEAGKLTEAPGGSAIDPAERGYYVRFAISKQNHGKPFEERWFARVEGGVLVPTTLYPVERRGRGEPNV